MILKILGSGSSGNGYLLISNQDALLIECGVKFLDVKKALDFDISSLSGCIASHGHGDHFKYAKEVISAGINLYTSSGTIKESKIEINHRVHIIKSQISFRVGSFIVMPFEVKHDVLEPLNFLIYHPEMGNLLFLTDTWYCPFRFQNLSQVMLEVNYSSEILEENLLSGKVNSIVYDRVKTSHMELNIAKDLLKANDLSAVNNIVLIHLSDGNSNAKEFQKEIQELTLKETIVADKNMTIPLNKYPF